MSSRTEAWIMLFHARVRLMKTKVEHPKDAWRVLWLAEDAVTQNKEPEYGRLCSDQRAHEVNQGTGSPDLEQAEQGYAAPC